MNVPRRRRMWPIMAALAAIVVTSISAVIWYRAEKTADSQAAVGWQPPDEPLLASSMTVMPVPGWQVSTTGLGLPDGTSFTTNEIPIRSEPFVGAIADRGYFVAGKPGSPTEWWLVAVDFGARGAAFPPVKLTSEDAYPPECFINGPDEVLCLRGRAEATMAWVVDAHTGAVIHTGPTTLNRAPEYPAVQQVGGYAVVVDPDRGVHGIGSRAAETWFVPGDGTVDRIDDNDLWHIPIATQIVGGAGSDTRVVFNLVDGRVLSPTPETGRRQLRAVVYPGGFAVEEGVDEGRVSRPDEIRFFDYDGRQLGAVETQAPLVTQSTDIPVTQHNGSEATAHALDGRVVARFPRQHTDAPLRLVGSRLFVDESSSSSFPEWTQFDLTNSGAQGNTCDVRISDRLGSDGRVLVLAIWNPGADAVAKGVNPVSCETLWRIPSRPQSFAQVVRINTTLVQLSDDGTELMSLVAPS